MDAKELKYLYRGVLILFGMALLLGGYLYLRIHFEVQDVTVNGSTHYSKEEIKGLPWAGSKGIIPFTSISNTASVGAPLRASLS